jgi:hypothetical protein
MGNYCLRDRRYISLRFYAHCPLLLGGKSWGVPKQEQFESGVVGAGGARIRLSANSIWLQFSSLFLT